LEGQGLLVQYQVLEQILGTTILFSMVTEGARHLLGCFSE